MGSEERRFRSKSYLSNKDESKTEINNLSQKSANEADVIVLSEEEIALFVEEATQTHSNGVDKYSAGKYCLLLLYTGMRVGELLALRWKDWDSLTNTVVIEKSISLTKNREKKSEKDNNYVSLEGTTKNQKARIIQLNSEAI